MGKYGEKRQKIRESIQDIQWQQQMAVPEREKKK